MCIGKESGKQVVMTLSIAEIVGRWMEGLEYNDEDEFLVKEGWVCRGVGIEVVADVFRR